MLHVNLCCDVAVRIQMKSIHNFITVTVNKCATAPSAVLTKCLSGRSYMLVLPLVQQFSSTKLDYFKFIEVSQLPKVFTTENAK